MSRFLISVDSSDYWLLFDFHFASRRWVHALLQFPILEGARLLPSHIHLTAPGRLLRHRLLCFNLLVTSETTVRIHQLEGQEWRTFGNLSFYDSRNAQNGLSGIYQLVENIRTTKLIVPSVFAYSVALTVHIAALSYVSHAQYSTVAEFAVAKVSDSVFTLCDTSCFVGMDQLYTSSFCKLFSSYIYFGFKWRRQTNIISSIVSPFHASNQNRTPWNDNWLLWSVWRTMEVRVDVIALQSKGLLPLSPTHNHHFKSSSDQFGKYRTSFESQCENVAGVSDVKFLKINYFYCKLKWF